MNNEFYKLNKDVLKDKRLTLAEKMIYTLLQDAQEYHKDNFYSYEEYIANEIDINEKTVRRGIDKLKKLGFITINRKYNKETKKTVNYYTVNDIPLTISTPVEEKAIKKVEDTTNTNTNNDNNQTITKLTIMETTKGNNQSACNNVNVEEKKEKGYSCYQYRYIDRYLQDTYGEEAEVYFTKFKDIQELGFTGMEKIAEGSQTTPVDVMNYWNYINEKLKMVG